MRAASLTSALALAGITLSAGLASAHVSVSPTTATANTTTEINLNVGHGCENADTLSITVDIPAGVTGTRAMPNAFGKVKVNRDANLNVVSVTWEKAVADLAATDDNFYKLTFRAKLPNTPFTTIYFPVHQVCQKPDGTQIKAEWTALTTNESESGPEPAGNLFVLPARLPGWNKYTLTAAIAKPEAVFGDAQIVWKGNAGWSVNPATIEQIKATPGATVATGFAAGDEIWVKY